MLTSWLSFKAVAAKKSNLTARISLRPWTAASFRFLPMPLSLSFFLSRSAYFANAEFFFIELLLALSSAENEAKMKCVSEGRTLFCERGETYLLRISVPMAARCRVKRRGREPHRYYMYIYNSLLLAEKEKEGILLEPD